MAEAQRRTNFRHFWGTELCDSLSQVILGYGHDIVQIYGTVRFQAIVSREKNLQRRESRS